MSFNEVARLAFLQLKFVFHSKYSMPIYSETFLRAEAFLGIKSIRFLKRHTMINP